MGEIPEKWIMTTLDEVGTITSGATPSTSDETNFGDDVPWVTPADLTGYTAQYISGGRRGLSTKGYQSCSATLIPQGSLLFSSRAPIGYVAIAANPIATNQGFKNLTPFGGIYPEYAYHYLKSAKRLAEGRASGTTFLELSAKAFAALPFPLPPLAEQERIVTKLEELFSRLDAGVDTLKRTQKLLRRYRQSVLRAAVTGELTWEWREKNQVENPDSETAKQLLERILAERRARWEQSGKKGKYAEPDGPDVTGLPELPEGWVWVSVAQVADVGTGATPLRSRADYYQNGSIPWITSGAINRSIVDRAEELITPLAVEETNAKIFPKGSLLVAMYGEGRTRGKIAELGISAATNQACAALIFQGSALDAKTFVRLFFEKNYDDLRRLSSGGVQPNLNLSIIKATGVPIAPLAEQAVIVQEVERRLSIIDGMETSLAAEVRRAESLRQSILHRAFTGQLVPQDPNDEPASELLKRIQAEREAAGETKRGRGAGKAPQGSQKGRGRPRKVVERETPGAAATTAQKRGRGRPRRDTGIPEAANEDEAIRLLEARKLERAKETRQAGPWEEK